MRVRIAALAASGALVVALFGWVPVEASAGHGHGRHHGHHPHPAACPSGTVPITGPGADSPCQRIVPQI